MGVVTRRVLATFFLVTLIAVPAWASDDTFFKDQWGLHKVQAEQAWSSGDGVGIVVAIVDSGVDRNHQDLSENMVPGYDFVDNDSHPDDETSGPGDGCPGNPGHGTHVAGIAAAVANNGYGIAGVAPKARIMPVRVLSKYGCGNLADVREGIAWAVRNGAHVVNLSLGENVLIRNALGPGLEDAVNDAWAKGVIPVVAAGNDVLFPSGYSNVNALVVGATDRNDQKAYFSNVSDAKWGLTAPGSGILSTLPGNKFGTLSGTSMATPHVSGAAAVMRCLGLNHDQSRQRILSSSDDLGTQGPDPVYGHGRLNVGKAASGLSGCSRSSSSVSSPSQGSWGSAPSSGSRSSAGSSGSRSTSGATSEEPSAGEQTASAPTPGEPEVNSEPATVASREGDRPARGIGNMIVLGFLVLLVVSYFVWQWWIKRKTASS